MCNFYAERAENTSLWNTAGNEVIAIANNTKFGLATYLFIHNAAPQCRVPETFEYAMVAVNTGLISNKIGSFGGIQQSGQGHEGSHYEIEEYLELKFLCIDISE